MAKSETIKAAIDANINTNGNQAITGAVMNAVLKQMVDSTDAQFTELSEKIDKLPKDDEFDKDGNYPSLHVGIADDLAGRGESVPAEFGFRASGGKSIKDGRAYIKRIKGNSVVWNQMVNGVGSLTLINSHKYMTIIGGVAEVKTSIVTLNVAEGDRAYDLTKMFGAGNEPSTIEDFNARVATLGVDMYAYNEGEVIHCNTESIKSVGDNAWDEVIESGYIDTTNGNKVGSSDAYRRSANMIKVMSGAEYYINATGARLFFYDAEGKFVLYYSMPSGLPGKFSVSSNACYLAFFTQKEYYNHDIMITLVHSGWKQDTDAGYQPYWQDTLPLPIIRKYFPQGMKSAGSAHDEIRFNKESGKWEYSKGKIKTLRLADLVWYYVSTNGYFYSTDIDNLKDIKTTEFNILCDVIVSCGWSNFVVNYNGNKATTIASYTMANTTKSRVNILNAAYTDVSAFIAWLEEAKATLYYESNDWEWVELDAEDQNFRDYYNVADFGTEMSQSSVPSANFSADIIYQFNAVDMIRENYNEIERIKAALAKAGITLDL